MADFYDNFSGNLSAWDIYPVTSGYGRPVWTEGGLLKIFDGPTGGFVDGVFYNGPDNYIYAQRKALLVSNAVMDINGTIEVYFNGLDLYNGDDNMIVFRLTDLNSFYTLKIQSGQLDERGLIFGKDQIEQNGSNDVDLTVYNSQGQDITTETTNKTIIPTTGRVTIDLFNNTYTIKVYNELDEFSVSATHIDNSYITSGYVGLAHDNKWEARLDGWNSFGYTNAGGISIPPEILEFSATTDTITVGQSVDLGWLVSSGSDNTTVTIDNGIGVVGLQGTTTVSPTLNTKYIISATSNAGIDVDTLTITVFDTAPIINDFSNNSPILGGTSALLSWDVSGAVSGTINNGIGNIDLLTNPIGNIGTGNLTVDTLYTLSAFDSDGDYAIATTLVDVVDAPFVDLSVRDTPVCSGGTYLLEWLTSGVDSLYIDNGIGYVSALPIGSLIISATLPTVYNASGTNALSAIDTDSAYAEVYYRDPVAEAGDDKYISVQGSGPATVSFNGTGSYDLDGLPLTYSWEYNSTVISTSPTFTYDFGVGTHSVTLTVTNSCGRTNSETIQVFVSSIYYPVAIAEADTITLPGSGTVNLTGVNSYDPDGTIVRYKWFYQGTLISSLASISYVITEAGVYTFTLEVEDNDGLKSTDTISIFSFQEFIPKADAGEDQYLCNSGTPIDIFLDGSNSKSISLDGTESKTVREIIELQGETIELVWYNWDLSNFGVPSQSAYISNTNEISAFINDFNFGGQFISTLTVSANNGLTDSDNITVNIFKPESPIITPNYFSATLPYGDTTYPVSLSAYTGDASNIVWRYNTIPNSQDFPSVKTGPEFNVNYGAGSYEVRAFSVDPNTGCESNYESAFIDIYGSDIKIISFDITPEYLFDSEAYEVTATLTWNIQGASSASIVGIGSVDPVSGSYDIVLNYGYHTFNLEAYDSSGTVVDIAQVTSLYEFGYMPITEPGKPAEPNITTVCAYKEDYILTYGMDELQYGKNKEINIVQYLPEYLRDTDVEDVLSRFEYYLNTMYVGQQRYEVGEEELKVTECTLFDCNRHVCCNGISGSDVDCDPSSTSANPCTGRIVGTYEIDNVGVPPTIVETPAKGERSVGEVFIEDICNIKDDNKISVLDKIFRLTELFDPDLIPIELIQFYADNLGYDVGISKEFLGEGFDAKSQEIEQKRYLRFMVRNLPNWYQIKTTRSAIKIMLYSFGVIGDFVYYYTSDYDAYKVNSYNPFYKCANINKGFPGGDTGQVEDYLEECFTENINIDAFYKCLYAFYSPDEITEILNSDCTDQTKNPFNNPEFKECYDSFNTGQSITYENLVGLKCNLEQFKYQSVNLNTAISNVNNQEVDNWKKSAQDPESVFEDIENANPTIPKEYFPTPHFNLVVNTNESSEKYVSDSDLRKRVSDAVKAVKPIQTVFEGVTLYFDFNKDDYNQIFVKGYVKYKNYIVSK